MHFEANAIQKALFIEIAKQQKGGSKEELVQVPEIVHALLQELLPHLTAIANCGKAAVRSGHSSRNAMILDSMRAMDGLPHDILHWLNDWKCIRDLVSPDVIKAADEETCRANFRTLASLDEGL